MPLNDSLIEMLIELSINFIYLLYTSKYNFFVLEKQSRISLDILTACEGSLNSILLPLPCTLFAALHT